MSQSAPWYQWDYLLTSKKPSFFHVFCRVSKIGNDDSYFLWLVNYCNSERMVWCWTFNGRIVTGKQWFFLTTIRVWHFFSIIRGKEWMHSQVFSSQFFSISGHTEFMASQPCHLPMHIQVISLSRCTAVFVVDQKRDYPTVSAIFCTGEMFEILRRQKDQTGRGRVVQDFRPRETTIPLVGLKL